MKHIFGPVTVFAVSLILFVFFGAYATDTGPIGTFIVGAIIISIVISLIFSLLAYIIRKISYKFGRKTGIASWIILVIIVLFLIIVSMGPALLLLIGGTYNVFTRFGIPKNFPSNIEQSTLRPSNKLFDDPVNPWRLKVDISTSTISQLEWSTEFGDNTPITWFEAENYCKNLSMAGGVKNGISWRLPTVEELMKSHSIRIPGDFQKDFYWSGTTKPEDSNQAWYVYMKDKGGPGSWLKKDATAPWAVRCVR